MLTQVWLLSLHWTTSWSSLWTKCVSCPVFCSSDTGPLSTKRDLILLILLWEKKPSVHVLTLTDSVELRVNRDLQHDHHFTMNDLTLKHFRICPSCEGRGREICWLIPHQCFFNECFNPKLNFGDKIVFSNFALNGRKISELLKK